MISRDNFFQIADSVVQQNGRSPLSEQPEVASCVEVLPTDRVLQILAGPGSGKTEVLVWRILFELFVNETEASRILVTTFTRKAANELQVRLADRSELFITEARRTGLTIEDPRIHNIRVGTLHSLCEQLLCEFSPAYRALGLTLIDEHEHRARLASYGDFIGGRQNGNLSRLIRYARLVGLFRPWLKPEWEWPTTRFDRLIFMNDLYSYIVETYIPRCQQHSLPHGLENIEAGIDTDLNAFYNSWRRHLEEKKVIDFAGIQLYLLEQQNIVNGHFTHVFVDEFQDNNPIQFLIHLGWLQDPTCKLTVVGDDDQAIYRFRGSDSACFRELQEKCIEQERPYRLERLQLNHRSTRNVSNFCQNFRVHSAINRISMPKTVRSPDQREAGIPIRIIRAPMQSLASFVSQEIVTLGYNTPLHNERESVAILASSTSEKERTAALPLRQTLEASHIRVYNPRAKTAALRGSALSDLLGVLSYLIDPISMAPVGKNGRMVEVWGLNNKSEYKNEALTVPPSQPENADHIFFQKWFRKPTGRGRITDTPADRQDVLDYVDNIKQRLLKVRRENTRLTLAGLIARIISLPYFSDTGFTVQFLRQALFTQLMEAFIIPTRQTRNPLDTQLEVNFENGKWVWDMKYWRFLGVFASVLNNIPIDDVESEAFEEGAVPLITFHQAKGLEFDHVYVIGGGKPLDVRAVLKNFLFSGKTIDTFINANHYTDSNDFTVQEEARADIDRELYVAISRAKKSLTLLSPTDPQVDILPHFREHSIIQQIVQQDATQRRMIDGIEIIEITYE